VKLGERQTHRVGPYSATRGEATVFNMRVSDSRSARPARSANGGATATCGTRPDPLRGSARAPAEAGGCLPR
jgi:hypothetical protein